jgi:hypothetical protein
MSQFSYVTTKYQAGNETHVIVSMFEWVAASLEFADGGA